MGRLPANVAAIKSMVGQTTIEVRGGGYGYRYHNGWGACGPRLRRSQPAPLSAGAILWPQLLLRRYAVDVGDDHSHAYTEVRRYGQGYGHGDSYGYYGYRDSDCLPHGGYVAARYYSW